jgi:hypothetical protein
MTTYDNWPINVLVPRDLNWWPSGGVDSGGASLSGLQQIDRIDGGPLWRCQMVQIPLKDDTSILAFQALQMILGGGATPIIVPRMPATRVPSANPSPLVPHSDGTPFNDDSLYSGDSVTSTLVNDADLRDYQITLDLVGGKPLMGGEEFSINHPDVGWRMYRIMRVRSQSGNRYAVDIGPPLRDDVAAGTALEWDNPRCMMRLADSEAFNTALNFNKYGYVDVPFIEAFFA